jgi:septal ring factor EnvC (AmiA/AmiB activator)
MLDRDEIADKVRDLMRRHRLVMERKAQLSGQLQAKKEELAKLSQEIREAGYDPATLADECKKAEANLLAEITAFEAELTKVEAALAVFDK